MEKLEDIKGPVRPNRFEDILGAALALFGENGFHGTAVPAVARRAGVGLGTIYRYFESKEALVNAVYQRCKILIYNALIDGFPFSAPPREQFHALWVRLLAFASEQPQVFDFLELHYHMPYLDQKSRDLEERALVPVRAFFEAASHAGLVKSLPTDSLIALTWGAAVGVIKGHRLGYYAITDELVAQTETCCWDALRR
jgi:AcrR family transcriptional regulator